MRKKSITRWFAEALRRRTLATASAVVAIVLIFAIALPSIAPSGSVFSAPHAKAQEEVLGDEVVSPSETSTGGVQSVTVAAKSGTISRIVLEAPDLPKRGQPSARVTNAWYVVVGQQRIPRENTTFDLSAGKYTFGFNQAVPVNEGDQVTVVTGYYSAPKPRRTTIYGQPSVAPVQEVIPVAPELMPAARCNEPKIVTVHETPGVTYDRREEGNTVTITATPLEGFAFPSGEPTPKVWQFDVTHEPCAATPGEKDTPQQPPAETPKDEPATTETGSVQGEGAYSVKTIGTMKVTSPTIAKVEDGNGSGQITTTVVGDSLFEKAIISVDAPNSILAVEYYHFDLTRIAQEPGDNITLGKKVLQLNKNQVVFEVFPMKDGKRLPSVKLLDGAGIKATASLTENPTLNEFKVELYGDVLEENIPGYTGPILIPGGELDPAICGPVEYYWVSVRKLSTTLPLKDRDGRTIGGLDYAVEFDNSHRPTGRMILLEDKASSDIAVDSKNEFLYALTLGTAQSPDIIRIQKYEIRSGRKVSEFVIDGATGGANSLSMAPDGQHLYVGGPTYGRIGKFSPVLRVNVTNGAVEKVGETNADTDWGGDFITLPNGDTLAAQSNGDLVMWKGVPNGRPKTVGKIKGIKGSTLRGGVGRETGTYVHGLSIVNNRVLFINGYAKRIGDRPDFDNELVVGALKELPSYDNASSTEYDYDLLQRGPVLDPGPQNGQPARPVVGGLEQNPYLQNWGMTSTRESNPCPPVEPKKPSFEVKKVADKKEATRVEDGLYLADYTVSVLNVTGVDGKFGQVVDYPVVPAGFELVKVEVNGRPAATPQRLAEGHIERAAKLENEYHWDSKGPYLISEGELLADGKMRNFDVKVYYKPKANIEERHWSNVAVCEDTQGGRTSPTGVPNVVSLAGELKERWDDNDACVTVVKDKDVTLAIEKIDFENKAQPLDGAEFKIFDADLPDWANTQPVAVLDERKVGDNPETSGYYTAKLKADKLYFLVETKSPNGYSLLAQPVLFRIVTDENGNQQIQFYDPRDRTALKNGGQLISIFKKDGKESKTVAYVQIADVTKGELPKTGGNGIGLWVLLGTAFIAAGWISTRRRSA